MTATPGAQQRPKRQSAVLLQGRVLPTTRDTLRAAADASGVSLSYYLDLFIQDHETRGKPLPILQPPRPQQEALTDAA